MPPVALAVTLRMLSAPLPRMIRPKSARPSSRSTVLSGPISRNCRLPRVVQSAYPPAQVSASVARPRNWWLFSTPPGMRSRAMKLFWAGATKNRPWNFIMNTSVPLGNRPSRAWSRTMSHVSSPLTSFRLACSSADSFLPAATNRSWAAIWMPSGPAGGGVTPATGVLAHVGPDRMLRASSAPAAKPLSKSSLGMCLPCTRAARASGPSNNGGTAGTSRSTSPAPGRPWGRPPGGCPC